MGDMGYPKAHPNAGHRPGSRQNDAGPLGGGAEGMGALG